MTCREFKHSAASLTLWEISRVEDKRILKHADTCEGCESWLRKQRSLAASMRTLQAETAGQEAGPGVERALLAAFRLTPAGTSTSALHGSSPHLASSKSSDGFTPLAVRLSRFFEIGAYAAVAAAIVVVVFLGIQLLPHGGTTKMAARQSASAPASTAPVAQAPAKNVVAKTSISTIGQTTLPVSGSAVRRPRPASVSSVSVTAQPVMAEASQTSNDDGYVALMFCDPLSCSSDAQVVRMELPAPAGQDAQPQVADVVVGYDGLVRAVRIVN
jgi:hypothetical protein